MAQKNCKRDLCRLLCKKYCQYYKPSSISDTFSCYGFIFVRQIIQKHPHYEFLLSLPLSGPKFVYQYDPHIYKLICQRCDFLKDGCDFRAQKRFGMNKPCSPCGGYIFITRLIANKYFLITSNNQQAVLRPFTEHSSHIC